MFTSSLRVFSLMSLFVMGLVVAVQAVAVEPFEIKAGDRVVVIGDTWFEREGVAAELETLMHQRWAPRVFSVRNLSFAADRPDGVSRASFDPAAVGFKRLKEQLALVKPTVAIIGYGMAAALEEMTYRTNDWTLNPDVARYGKDFTAARFQKDLLQLISALDEVSGAAVRVVLVAPIRPEDLRASRPRLPNPAALRTLLIGYQAAIAAVAKERGARLVDTPSLIPQKATLTFNGIHPTSAGLAQWAKLVATDLGWASQGERILTAPQSTALRAALVRKNDLFFHRWRPANVPYLFTFRKHEQGGNAVEMQQFDALLGKADALIAALMTGADPVPLPAKMAPLPINTAASKPDFTMDKGMSAELWAANPLISKPLHTYWDTSGRMWIASTPIYPQIEPGAVASDRIFIVEDTDHDGKADRSTIFSDDLLIPSTVAPNERVDGKLEAYVGASTNLFLLTDTNGDGKADTKLVVLSGFGAEDTHHIVHTLFWGQDGRLYLNQSIYIHSHLETPWGVVRLNAGGTFAYDTASERVEVLMKGMCNTWGHQMDKEGQSFFTDGCGDEGLVWGLPSMVIQYGENSKFTGPSISNGNYPKFAGLELIHSPLFPADWQGDAITCDFRAHRMVRMGINLMQGKSGYVSNDKPDLMKTNDAWFRPIDVRHGPDGALYLADWTNPIINHGEVDFRDARRDHVHGRIWRVAPTESKPLSWTPVHGRTILKLCEALISENFWERDCARRVLASRLDDAADKQIRTWLTKQTKLNEKERVALSSGLSAVYLTAGRPSLLNEPNKGKPLIERTPLSDLLFARHPTADLNQSQRLAKLKDLFINGSLRTQIEAARGLARMPSVDAALVVLSGIRTELISTDPFYAFAMRMTLDDVAGPILEMIADGSWKTKITGKNTVEDLARVLLLLQGDQAAPAVKALLAQGDWKLSADDWGALIAHAGDAQAVARLYGNLDVKANPDGMGREAKILAWCAQAAQRGVVLTGEKPLLAPYLQHKDDAVRKSAVRLAGLWKRADLAPVIGRIVTDKNLGKDALTALQAIGGELAVKELSTLIGQATTAPERAEMLAVLAKIDGAQALAIALPYLKAAPNVNEAGALWRVLWAGNGVLERVVKDGLPADLPVAAITSGLSTTKELGGRGNAAAALFQAAQPKEAVAVQDAGAKPADLAGWVALTKRDGVPAKGEARYFALGCAACHAIGGAGGKLGPDMTTLGASAPLDYIVESVVQPSLKVKEGYHSVIFHLKDGSLVTGIPAAETDREVTVRMTANEQVVAKDTIVSREIVAGSLMPMGLVDLLPAADQAHLYAFLSQLGKPGPFDASDRKIARILRVSATLPEGAEPDLAKLQPAYATVDGRILTRAWRTPISTIAGTDDVYAMAQVDVPVAGQLIITVTGEERPWLDGVRLGAGETGRAVTAGRHTIAVLVNRKKPNDGLRMSVNEGRFITP